MQFFRRIVLLALFAVSCSALADHPKAIPTGHSNPSEPSPPPSPWFTGPLLAPSGHVFPAGHLGFEPYVFYTDDYGHFNTRGAKISTLSTRIVNPTMVIFYGLAPKWDMQISVPYFFTSQNGRSDNGFSDVSFTLGYQLLSDVAHTAMPDLRLTLAEVFPTGQFENLNPVLNGTDSHGAGSFQTVLGATLQKLWYISNGHFLRGRLNFTYAIPADVKLRGLNAYGGAPNTAGKIRLGNHFSTDLAFEYTITRHWVPAIDFLYINTNRNQFSGFTGTTASGLPAPIVMQSVDVYSIAPAMEYNFNGNVGLILGVWFTVAGGNATEFTSGVFALDISL